MTIEKNKIVTVTYELRLGGKDGEVVEVADKNSPLLFPYGNGMLLPAFELALFEKEIGDSFEVDIDAINGYGVIDEYMVVNIPKDTFMIDGKIDEEMVSIGNTLPMMSTTGKQMNGLIVSIEDDDVIMDFNHPLAGQDLYFSGEVIGIRDATESELEHCNTDCDSEDGCGECGCGHKH